MDRVSNEPDRILGGTVVDLAQSDRSIVDALLRQPTVRASSTPALSPRLGGHVLGAAAMCLADHCAVCDPLRRLARGLGHLDPEAGEWLTVMIVGRGSWNAA